MPTTTSGFIVSIRQWKSGTLFTIDWKFMFIIFNVETGLDFGFGFIGVEVRGERGCSKTLYLLDVLNVGISVNTEESKLGRPH